MKQIAPGVIITRKYLLERPLASGGMGSVWIARHVELDVAVAIKFISPELASSNEGRRRFEREAKAAARIHSSNIVHVQDYGVDDEVPYIVMELMHGEDLEDRLERRGRLSLQEASLITMQVARGLRRAHELDIVHRDLKPQNIFLSQNDDEEVAKILDFGIAKTRSAGVVTDVTSPGGVLGSPHYMSPEQVRGSKDVDPLTDLWALGVVAFRMTTGALPFVGEEYGEVMAKILVDPIPLATQIAPDLPPAVDEFFAKALARDRAERFQSARELAEALAAVARAPIAPASLSGPGMSMTPLLPAQIERTSNAPPPELAITRGTALVSTISLPTSGATPSLEASRGDRGGLKALTGERQRLGARSVSVAIALMAVAATVTLTVIGRQRAGFEGSAAVASGLAKMAPLPPLAASSTAAAASPPAPTVVNAPQPPVSVAASISAPPAFSAAPTAPIPGSTTGVFAKPFIKPEPATTVATPKPASSAAPAAPPGVVAAQPTVTATASPPPPSLSSSPLPPPLPPPSPSSSPPSSPSPSPSAAAPAINR